MITRAGSSCAYKPVPAMHFAAGPRVAVPNRADRVSARWGPARHMRNRWLRRDGFGPRASVVPAGGAFSPLIIRDQLALPSGRRRQILETIRAHPGYHYRGLLRLLDLSDGNLRHHLRSLEAESLITALPHRGRVHYFDSCFAGPRAWLTLPVRDRQIVDLVRANPGMMEKAIASSVPLSPSRLSRRLHQLEREGWLGGRRVAPTTQWFALR